VIAKKKPANGFLMRGIAHQPHIPLFADRYQLKPACIAVYPMYKGLAQLVGMKKLEGRKPSPSNSSATWPSTTITTSFSFITNTRTCTARTEFSGEEKGHRGSGRGAAHSAEKTARSAGGDGRSFDAVRGEGAFVASAAGAAG
jgi:2,3-bisphosphoglycerate-independent phosphoglycerate mutase